MTKWSHFILFYFLLYVLFYIIFYLLFYFILFYLYVSRCSVVDTATRLQEFESRQGQIVFSSPKRPDQLWRPSSLLFNCYRCSSPGIRREVDHSPPSNDEVRNEWSYTSTPLCFFLIFIYWLLPVFNQLCIPRGIYRRCTNWYNLPICLKY
jgi:Ca2+/Na+ antiporter